jgi:hypothetical protein
MKKEKETVKKPVDAKPVNNRDIDYMHQQACSIGNNIIFHPEFGWVRRRNNNAF